MNNLYTIFMFTFVFSPLMYYGIGLESVFTESSNLKTMMLRLPLFMANVMLTVLIAKPLSMLMISLDAIFVLLPVIVFVTSSIISAVSVLIVPYVLSDGRPFSGLFAFGLALLSVIQGTSLSDSLLLTFSGILSFVLATLLLAAVADRLQYSNVPLYFKGIPLVFVSLGLLSLLFYAAGISWWVTE